MTDFDCCVAGDCAADGEAFEAFASAYPHETYDEWPDRFWAFFQRVSPGVSREDMVRTLNETRASSPPNEEPRA